MGLVGCKGSLAGGRDLSKEAGSFGARQKSTELSVAMMYGQVLRSDVFSVGFALRGA